MRFRQVYLSGDELLRALLDVKAAKADADGTGGDEDYAVAVAAEANAGFDEEGEIGDEGFVGDFVADRGGTCGRGVSRMAVNEMVVTYLA